MMLLEFRIKRLRKMAQEFARLVRVQLLSWDSIRLNWRMNGLDKKQSGMPWREVEITYHMDLETAGRAPSDRYPRSKAFPRGYVERTEKVRVSRDYLDVVFDFVFDILRTFWKNVFITSRCSHPHQYVRQEWDGDQDVGYIQQHRCSRCHDYISCDDIDQYLPEQLRRPDLILFAPKPVFMEDEPLDEDEQRLEYADYD